MVSAHDKSDSVISQGYISSNQMSRSKVGDEIKLSNQQENSNGIIIDE